MPISRRVELAPTVLDVVDNFFGFRPRSSDVTSMSIGQLQDLSDRLNEFWDAQDGDAPEDGGYLIGDWVSAFWSEPSLRVSLSDSLLYYPRLIVIDPLADFFGDRELLPEMRAIRFLRRDGQYNSLSRGPRLWSEGGVTFEATRHSPREASSAVARIVTNLYELERLIRAEVLVLRSQWPIFRDRHHQLATSVRHDVLSPEMQRVASVDRSADEQLAVWDNLRGMHVSSEGSMHPSDRRWQWEPEFYYLAKSLAVADAAGATYVPGRSSDMELLQAKFNSSFGVVHPENLLREVARIALPSADIGLARAVAVRSSSENFEDWRSAIDNLRRSTATASSAAELRSQVEDELRPRARNVSREIRKSSLAGSFREEGTDYVISGVAGLAAAYGTGEGVIAAGAAAGAGALSWMARAYMRKGPEGADAVLATLIRK